MGNLLVIMQSELEDLLAAASLVGWDSDHGAVDAELVTPVCLQSRDRVLRKRN